MMYAWGQFVDHDLTLGAGDRRVDRLPVRIDIAVPPGDPVFPDGSVIPLTRVGIAATSGTDAEHPRSRPTSSPAGTTRPWSTARTPKPRPACACRTGASRPRRAATCPSWTGASRRATSALARTRH
jgi:hypothetical protein